MEQRYDAVIGDTPPTLAAGALAVSAPRPAAGPTLAILQFLPGPANAPLSGHALLGILHPADELVAGQGRYILPGIECRGVGDQRLAKISWKLVHHPTGHSRAAHKATVAGGGEPYHQSEDPDRKFKYATPVEDPSLRLVPRSARSDQLG